MKGAILAGGTGTRLKPLTNITNKHLLPVYNKPMIAYPLETLKSIGVDDIAIVTGGEYISDFARFTKDGVELGVNITYKVQNEPRGIADALLKLESFFGKENKVIAILGDNIFEKVKIDKRILQDEFAYVFISKVKDPTRFGNVVFDKDGNIDRIEEKPKEPKSEFAVTGLYIYPNDVFDFIKTLKPSSRGELEITDVNNHYLQQKKLKAIKLEGFWSDAGTFDSLLESGIFISKTKFNL
ncbi:MAG: sugar phosphate nucleotidyltransferase [Candidatus Micrarchaeaceae archaeon]